MGRLTIRDAVCVVLAIFFAGAGVMHFTHLDGFIRVVPPFLPFKAMIVMVTGVMEWIFAIGLIIRRTRRVTGWVLSAYLLAVLPANIYMAMNAMPLGAIDTPIGLWTRVAMQFPLIGLILWACTSLRPDRERGPARPPLK